MLPILAGYRIIDITTIVFGPFASQMLGDLGADVIKVEPPEGDLLRAIPPHNGAGIGAGFANNNRNKRSLALDLKNEDGRRVLEKLIATADVFLHNMRQTALDRLGFTVGRVLELNPRIIYCAGLGYGSDGPYAGRPAYDDIIQAGSGLAGLHQMRDGEPMYAPSITADKVGALYITQAVLGALLHRERTRCQGFYVEVPMFEAITAFAMNEHLDAATYEADGHTGYHRALARNRKPHRTADGWIGLLPYTSAQWTRVLKLIGREDIIGESWFQNPTERSKRIHELYGHLADALPSRTSAEWLTLLEAADIPCAQVNTTDDVLQDRHHVATRFFAANYGGDPNYLRAVPYPIHFSNAEIAQDNVPPQLGAATRDLMRELGYDGAEIERLAAAGAVRVTKHDGA